jgi:hypothetical protein
MSSSSELTCEQHGTAYTTFVCVHLLENSHQGWYSSAPTSEDPWPDAWCHICDEIFMREGEWNEKNEDASDIRILCHLCYEARRLTATGYFN